MIGAIRSLKIVSSPSLSQGSQGGRPAFEPNKSLEKNGRAWLLPSYLRTKLGRSLALPMKLQAIPKGKLYDLQARGKKVTLSSQRNGVTLIIMVFVLGGLAIALLTLAGQTSIQMKSIRNVSLDNQQCSELIALGEQVLAARLLANAEFSSETIRLNLPQTSVLTNPSQPQIGIVELSKTASADSRNRWTINASFGAADGLSKQASKTVYLNKAMK